MRVHGFGDQRRFGDQTLKGVENGVPEREERVDEDPKLHPLADPAHHYENRHVLHDQTAEHATDVEQDGLHGAIPHKVRNLLVTHDEQEQREEGHERNERVPVKELHRRGEDEHRVLEQRQKLVRAVRERNRPHQRNHERYHRQDSQIGRRSYLTLVRLVPAEPQL